MDDKINLCLSPHEAMQFLRWKNFLTAAINDPYHMAEDYDRAGIIQALNSVCEQTRASITVTQLDAAFAEQEVNKLIDKKAK